MKENVQNRQSMQPVQTVNAQSNSQQQRAVTTGILSVKDANRRINNRKLEEMDKSRRRVQQEAEKENAKKEAEKAEFQNWRQI